MPAVDAISQRKLGENDPGRYEVRILIGPCTLAEAEKYVERLWRHTHSDSFGASLSLGTFDETEVEKHG